jgi:hypothetical protein
LLARGSIAVVILGLFAGLIAVISGMADEEGHRFWVSGTTIQRILGSVSALLHEIQIPRSVVGS